jgi:hypothetical protein
LAIFEQGDFIPVKERSSQVHYFHGRLVEAGSQHWSSSIQRKGVAGGAIDVQKAHPGAAVVEISLPSSCDRDIATRGMHNPIAIARIDGAGVGANCNRVARSGERDRLVTGAGDDAVALPGQRNGLIVGTQAASRA